MNLYNLHPKPELLKYHAVAHEYVPELFWDKYENNPEELKKREDAIAKSAAHSYWYALKVLKEPFPKGEDAIAKNASYSHAYARDVLKHRFLKGEDAILQSVFSAAYIYTYQLNFN